MPWWDYLVPVALLAQGLVRKSLTRNSAIYHLMHDERWNDANFMAFGELFRAELDKIKVHGSEPSGFQILCDRLLWVEHHNPILPYPRRTQFLSNLIGVKPQDLPKNRILWMGSLCIRFYEKPEEGRLGFFNPDRLLNRLPY
jgi:hypothetical protein